MIRIYEWLIDHWEGLAWALGAPIGGAFVWLARRGTIEALGMHSEVRRHCGRLDALERSMCDREVLCTDHRAALEAIEAAINDGRVETLAAIHAVSERVANLEGYRNGQRH